MRTRLLPSLTLLVVAAACAEGPTPMDPAHLAELEEWRAERVERLRADDGWLTLVGLEWLEPGESTVGAAAGADVKLPDGAAPAEVGTIELAADGTLTFRAAPGAEVTLDGEPVEEVVLATDAEGAPTELRAGRVLFYPIARGEKTGLRIKDPEAVTRTEFAGIEHYPPDDRFRVEATFEAYPSPRRVRIPTLAGAETEMLAPGVLRFELLGRELTLQPMVSSPEDDSLFLVFADDTSGVTTYGACRFLLAERPPDGGATVLDFNYAYNPPCAFTPFATCPLPPEGNRLPVLVAAGEKYSGGAH